MVLLVLMAVATTATYEAGVLVAKARGIPFDADGWPLLGEVGEVTVDLLAVAVWLPAVALTVRWIQQRPWGSVSSVAGRIRWGWLGRCLAIAAPTVVVALVCGGALSSLTDPGVPPDDEAGWVGGRTFLAGLAVIILLVPLQAAAEEYVFRGWLLQATGAFLRSPWLVLAPQAALFAAAHGWGTPWGFADLAAYGALTGWLTIRTGGLEAAIALHVVTNLIPMSAAASFVGGLASDETAADMPWSMAVADVIACCLYAAVILRLARRRKLATHHLPPQGPADDSHRPWGGAATYPPVEAAAGRQPA
ncbi:CPBP family intramembrane glutamic endopeptidase [Kribbella flavida]|uniref:CPBP family intramembrane glutamic endopeptidase n=1 Tax=Kribbella flavida TaxID=182640 RepID=UPI00030B08E3|nr:CPBP family intramembrane glutamic endopeptidase [Kribbella flavida]